MRDVSSVIGDVVKITNYRKRSEDFDIRQPKPGQNDCFEATDLETAITATGLGRYNWLALLVAMPASVTSSTCTGAISIVLPQIGCEFQCSNAEKGALQAASYLGMILSGFFWGSASDTLGRINLITYGFILEGIVSILAALSPTLWWMIFFKTISGALNCGPYSIYMTYLSESFNAKYRDYAVLSMGIFSAMGNVLQPACALLITFYIPFEPVAVYGGYTFSPWRLFLVLSTLPSLAAGFGSMFLSESPKFLFRSGNSEGALNVCKKIYTCNTGRLSSTFPVHKIIDPNSETSANANEGVPEKKFFKQMVSGLALSMSLFKKPYVGRALMLCTIQLGALASVNCIRLWLPQIFAIVDTANSHNSTSSSRLCEVLEKSSSSSGSSDCDLNSSAAFVNMMIVNSFMFVSQLLFIATVKYLGRKVPVVITTLTPAIFAAGMTFVDVKYVVYLAAVYTSTLNAAFFAIAYLVTETFPTCLRATSLNTTQLSGRVGVMFTVSFVSMFMFTHCHIIIPGMSALLITISVIAMLLPMTPFDAPSKSTQ